MKTWQVIVISVLVGLLAAGLIIFVATRPKGQPYQLLGTNVPGTIKVHVSGQVKSPGLVSVTTYARVQDAVNAAGGLTSEADLNAINLAAVVTDGQKLNIPKIGAVQVPVMTEPGLLSSKVNINTASAVELENLPGIGETRANDIIRYRQNYGHFQKIEDLLKVPGIGETIYNQLKDQITVGP